MENKEVAIAAIRACKTRKTLEDTLKRFEIANAEKTIKYLKEAMYNPETFFPTKHITVEDESEFTIQVFLTRTWQLNSYYDKMVMSK